MAKLSAAQRRRLPKSSFAMPGSRSYPIHDRAHARAALRLAGQKRTKGSAATIRAKVARKYPSLVKKKTTAKGKTGGKRRSGGGRRRR